MTLVRLLVDQKADLNGSVGRLAAIDRAAGAFLVIQFLVVYMRVLPYLVSTFGADSAIHRVFQWLGFPLGMLALDVLMFLAVFDDLVEGCARRCRAGSNGAWRFLLAYRSTRTVVESATESLPQALLQSYIFVRVMATGIL